MKTVFWIFQFLFALVFIFTGAYYLIGPSQSQFQWNWSLISLYLVLQCSLWFGYYLAKTKDDVPRFLWGLVGFDFVLGLIAAVIYAAIAGAKNNDLAAVLMNSWLIVAGTVLLGNAPTAAGCFYLLGRQPPKIKKKKLPKKDGDLPSPPPTFPVE